MTKVFFGPEEIIAASYGRTSGESGDSVSLNSQLIGNSQFANPHSIHIAYEFKEEFTGTKIERPKLNEIRKLIAQRKINAIIVYASDRLARSEYVAQYLFNEVFVPNGIRLFIASGNKEVDPSSPESLLMWSVENIFSAYERNKIVERFGRAKRTMRNEGIWVGEGGQTTYGYEKVGRKRDSRIELIPDECAVVRRIFTLFLEGKSTTEIARILTTAEVPTPASKTYIPFHSVSRSSWSANTVYHILKNEKYVGRWYANRWHDHGEKDKSEWVRIDLPHTQIVSVEAFKAAQARLVENRRKAGPENVNEYLLSRRCKCGICGYSVVAYTKTNRLGKKYSYYACNGRNSTTKKFNPVACTLPVFTSKDVDAILWEHLVNFIINPAYREETLDQALEEQRTKHSEALAMIDAADRAKARYRDELLRLTSLFTEGDIDRDVFRTKKAEIQARYEAAMNVEAEYEDALQGVLTARDVEQINRTMDVLRKEFEKLGDLSFKRRVQLLDAMGITGTFTLEGGAPYLYVYAHSAKVLRMPLDTAAARPRSSSYDSCGDASDGLTKL